MKQEIYIVYNPLRNMVIYTHVNVDLDAVASVWAAKTFIPEAEFASFEFVPANWDGEGMRCCDLAVDIPIGIKGDAGEEGRVHSCFASIIQKHASPEDQQALKPLVSYIDIHDAHGSIFKKFETPLARWEKSILASTSLTAVLRAFQAQRPGDDRWATERMFDIFSGMLKTGQARGRAFKEAEGAHKMGPVAIVVNAEEYATNGILFEHHKIRAIIFVDGNNIGVVRESGEAIRMDHPLIQEVVKKAGELDEWFAHPAGFLFCRGSRKAPSTTPSTVDPEDLAQAVQAVFEEDFMGGPF